MTLLLNYAASPVFRYRLGEGGGGSGVSMLEGGSQVIRPILRATWCAQKLQSFNQ